ncbi:Flp family type IVb pilin [Vibrio gigantis]|uniref:Flp family type IVb pilin n=1 Tax=Vibrio gigantis TaxID=296199 RepID=A0A5M9N685_9VIBR|nr:Flp family type IVb pilin [Vibrio gigantis]KAA8666520.1 Flp family type IVb pilin [Vibrio gigantis]
MITHLFVKAQLFTAAFKNDQRGVTAIEYAILGVCMSAIVLAVFGDGLTAALNDAVAAISQNITDANTVELSTAGSEGF